MVGSRHRSAAVAEEIYIPESPEPSSEDQRRAGHRQPAKTKTRPVAGFIGTVAILCGLLLILGIRQAAITQMGYEIDAMKRRLVDLENQRAALAGQVALLKAPDRIEATAYDMGMGRTEERRVLDVPTTLATVEPEVEAAGSGVVVPLPQPPGEDSSSHLAGIPGWTIRMAEAGSKMFAWLRSDHNQ